MPFPEEVSVIFSLKSRKARVLQDLACGSTGPESPFSQALAGFAGKSLSLLEWYKKETYIYFPKISLYIYVYVSLHIYGELFTFP